MTGDQFAGVLASVCALLVLAHLLGAVCARLRQPRFLGEIVAGVLVGPAVFGEVAPDLAYRLVASSAGVTSTLGLLHWIGLLLLMFLSGTQVRHVLAKETHRAT